MSDTEMQDFVALEAELAELRKDKARLDWLESKGFETFGPPPRVLSWVGVDAAGSRRWTIRTRLDGEFVNARDAIDAAMEGK